MPIGLFDVDMKVGQMVPACYVLLELIHSAEAVVGNSVASVGKATEFPRAIIMNFHVTG